MKLVFENQNLKQEQLFISYSKEKGNFGIILNPKRINSRSNPKQLVEYSIIKEFEKDFEINSREELEEIFAEILAEIQMSQSDMFYDKNDNYTINFLLKHNLLLEEELEDLMKEFNGSESAFRRFLEND